MLFFVLSTTFLFLGSGVSLLLAIGGYVSLPMSFIFIALAGSGNGYFLWNKLSQQQKNLLKRRFNLGLFAGALATAAYDGSRFILCKLFFPALTPFKAFPFFGKLIFPAAGNELAWAVGSVYHCINGLSFAVAYAIGFSGKPVIYAVLYAFFLEVLMLIVYPDVLDLSKVLEEFTIVSMTGHFFYGLVLGQTCKNLKVENT